MNNQQIHLNLMGALQDAASHATAGYWTEDEAGFHLARIMLRLEHVADVLGYDLVKRKTAQEAHEARVAQVFEFDTDAWEATR
jgi:hypothetical protein